MRKLFASITARLSAYIIVITVVIFCSIAFVFGKYGTSREEHNAKRYTSVLLQNMLQKIDRKLSDVENSVAATLPLVQNSLNSPDSLMSIIERMVWNNGNLMGGCVAFEPGFYPQKRELFMEYVSLDTLDNVYRKHLGGDDYNYTKMQWYTEAKSAGHRIWSEPYFDEKGGDILMTTFALPMIDKNGKFYGVVTADISLDDMVSDIDAIRPFPDSYSFILSKKGVFISFPDKDYILKESSSYLEEPDNRDMESVFADMSGGGRGIKRVTSPETSDLLACYAPVLRTGWSICCICPFKTIMHDLGDTIFTIIMILLAGLVVLLVSIRVVLVYAMKPMTELTDAAYTIAKGCFDNPLPAIESNDEMKKLHDAFSFMQSSLKNYTAELEATTRSKERIKSELNISREIQMSMIPRAFSPFAECGNLSLYAMLEPARVVSGDLYDFFIRNDKLFFTIGDVSGKGIPASLVMATTCTLFRVMADKYNSPAEIAATINRAISNRNDANMFITMFFGVLDLKTGFLEYCNAGHNPPVLVSPNGSCSFVETNPNLPIGILNGFEYKAQSMTLPLGASLLLYTDGITEAENTNNEQFGEQRMTDVLKGCTANEPKDLLLHLLRAVRSFTGSAEQNDDITALCVKLKEQSTDELADYCPGIYRTELVIDNKIEEVERLYPFVMDLGNHFSIASPLVNSINLALEEALVNAVEYAYNGKQGKVSLSAEFRPATGTLVFVLSDSGVAFNPLEHTATDTSLPLQEREIGGLGIFLIKEIMDKVEYCRQGDMNILTMYKSLPDKNRDLSGSGVQ